MMNRPAIAIDGKNISEKVCAEVSARVQSLSSAYNRPPTLAVVLVGDNPASQVYVRSKSKKAKACGIGVVDLVLGAVSNQELQTALRALSQDELIDGILLQLPLPKGLDEFEALKCISPEKDADGLHPFNQGLLMRGSEGLRPCTPFGAMRLIDEARETLGKSRDLSGLHAVVLGRSILVGKAMALMLLERNCTVTICHSKTNNLKDECKRADILVAAIGKPEFVTKEFIKEGSIVIDVGINRLADGRIVGDVEYEHARALSAAVTPVPGGVGPMTIAMLLSNTVDAFERRMNKKGLHA